MSTQTDVPSAIPQDVVDIEEPPTLNPDLVFYNRDGLVLEHYWPNTKKANILRSDESEILAYNTGDSPITISANSMTFLSGENRYHATNVSWEKFPSFRGWQRMEYLTIGGGHYDGTPLIIKSGEKAKIHYNFDFTQNILDLSDQNVQIKITYAFDGTSVAIDEEISRFGL